MGDYACIHCQDNGDCNRCSYFFEKDKVHAKCGVKWGDHKVMPNMAPYAPYAVCPAKAGESDGAE